MSSRPLRGIAAALGLVSLCCGLALALHHPLSAPAASAAFLGWTLAALRWPRLWLTALPALLPILGLNAWSGWVIFDEFDLAVLGLAAASYIGFARSWPQGALNALPRSAWTMLILVVLWQMLAMTRAVAGSDSLQFSWFEGYTDPLNAWRVSKSWLYALLLTPALLAAITESRERVVNGLANGMTLGLALLCAIVLWERATYPGLFDFSESYRTSALFWEMHIGGAAIDFYLVLATPFALRFLLQAATRLRWAAAALLLIVVTYVCLTTFSRGLYLGLLVSFIMIYRLQKASGANRSSNTIEFAWRTGANKALFILLAIEASAILFGGTFMLDRLGASQRDFGSRLEHWTESAGLLKTPSDMLLGIGPGSYPAAYSKAYPARELPAGFAVRNDDKNAFVELLGPASQGRLGGLFGIGQKLLLEPDVKYVVSMDVRAAQPTRILVKTCVKHLIHEMDCRSRVAAVQLGEDWQHMVLPLPPTGGPIRSARPGWLSISLISPGRSIEIDNVDLLESKTGTSLLVNGAFSQGGSRWLLTGHRYFVPWHTDNLYLEATIDVGLVGLVLYLGFFLRALIGQIHHRASCGVEDRAILAAVLGALALGLFNSLFDVARVAFAFIILCILIAAWPGVSQNSD